uniref:Claudin n=1 Tax=Eptatretus burgeri TaxID=7764 RepID=A0A8C4WZN0_EPTBU
MVVLKALHNSSGSPKARSPPPPPPPPKSPLSPLANSSATLSSLSLPTSSLVATTMLSETTIVGLWYTCVDQGSQWECKAYDTFLGVPSTLLAARCLLVLSDLLCFLGTSVTIISLRCIRLPCEISSRTRVALTACAGTLCSLAAATTLVPVSAIAYQTVQGFFDPNLPDFMPRYELGDAIFLGWGSGISSLIAAVLLFVAAFCHRRESLNDRLKVLNQPLGQLIHRKTPSSTSGHAKVAYV